MQTLSDKEKKENMKQNAAVDQKIDYENLEGDYKAIRKNLDRIELYFGFVDEENEEFIFELDFVPEDQQENYVEMYFSLDDEGNIEEIYDEVYIESFYNPVDEVWDGELGNYREIFEPLNQGRVFVSFPCCDEELEESFVQEAYEEHLYNNNCEINKKAFSQSVVVCSELMVDLLSDSDYVVGSFVQMELNEFLEDFEICDPEPVDISEVLNTLYF